MNKKNTTPLKKAFIKSKLKRAAVRELITYEQLPEAYSDNIQEMLTEAILEIDDEQIIKTLKECRRSKDATKAQRKEIDQLLFIAESTGRN